MNDPIAGTVANAPAEGVTAAGDEVDTDRPVVLDIAAVLTEAAESNSRRIQANAVNSRGVCGGATGAVVPAIPPSAEASVVATAVLAVAWAPVAGAGVAAAAFGVGAVSRITGAGVLACVTAEFSVAIGVMLSDKGVADAPSDCAVRLAVAGERLCITDLGAGWRIDKAGRASMPGGRVVAGSLVNSALAPPIPIVAWDSGVVLDGPPELELWSIEHGCLSAWPDGRGLLEPSLSAWAMPDALANAAPTPTVTAPAPSQSGVPVPRRGLRWRPFVRRVVRDLPDLRSILTRAPVARRANIRYSPCSNSVSRASKLLQPFRMTAA